MVDTDVHDIANDSRLDLSCVPSTRHWTSRKRARTQVTAWRSNPNHRRRRDLPRHRLHGLADDLRCLHLPPDDPKATPGKLTAWHVHLSRTLRLHHRWNRW